MRRRASASDAGLVSAVPVSSRLLLTAFAAVASTGGGQADAPEETAPEGAGVDECVVPL